MPKNKAQIHRLIHISAMLKENRYPTAGSLADDFRRMALAGTIPDQCSVKTVRRDIKTLKEEFNCPVVFDHDHNGFRLTHHGWNFNAPALLDENELLAATMGARIAEMIFPSPLKNTIRDAVDYLLQGNNPDFLDTANMASLLIYSGLPFTIDPEIFMTFFRAWQTRRCVRISYIDYNGNETHDRIFEPQTLVYYEHSWYSKGYCRLRREPRTFAIQRITSAELLEQKFYTIPEIINSVTPDDFLGFQRITNIKLRISDQIRKRLQAQPLHTKQVFHDDGTVDIPSAVKETLIPFVLSAEGQAEILAPENLRTEIKEKLRAMLTAY